MKSSRSKLLAATAVALLAVMGFSQSSPTTAAPSHRGRHFGRMLGVSARYLNLTDTQKAQMKDILAKEKPTIQPLIEQLAQNRQEMHQLESSGTFDETKVRALATAQSQTMTELMVQKSRIRSELIELLTPDQKTKLATFEARRLERFQQRLREGQSAPSEAAPNP